MSSSSAEPTLSIVVGSNGAPASVEACLAALEPQVNGAEVLVCEPEASPLICRFWATASLWKPPVSGMPAHAGLLAMFAGAVAPE